MSKDESPHPTKLYVNCFLREMINREITEFCVFKSTPLPIYPELRTNTVAWQHLCNRLKVMSDIGHLAPPKNPVNGRIKLVVFEDVGQEEIQRSVTVHTIFDDSVPDPFVKLRFEYESTSRGPHSLK